MVCSALTIVAASCLSVTADGMMVQSQARVDRMMNKGNAVASVSGIAQVIELVTALKTEISDDGTSAATLYATEAQTCKDKDEDQSAAIVGDKDKIDTLSGEIGTDSMSKAEKQTKLAGRRANQQTMTASLKTEVVGFSKAAAEYQAGSADNAKGIASLTKAIDTMTRRFGAMNTPPAAATGTSFVQVSLNDLFDGAAPPKVSAVAKDPAFKYHSTTINTLLASTLQSFQDEKSSQDVAWEKTRDASVAEKAGLADKMKTNMDAMTNLEGQIQGFLGEVAKERKDVVLTSGKLDSDAALLKTTTASCEASAAEFDRKALLQNQVVSALTKVLEFLGQTGLSAGAADTSAATVITDVNPEAGTRIQEIADAKTARREAVGLSFLQSSPVVSFLAKGRTAVELAKMEKVISILRGASNKLSSPELSMLVMNIGGVNHFKNVESMIHNLISKLLEENDREISKSGFCKTEVAKSNEARSMAKRKADGMSADLSKSESIKETLEVELTDMAKEIVADNVLLKKLIQMRKETKDKNMATIKHAKEGITALEQAKASFKEAAGAQDKVAAENTPQAGTAEERVGTGAKAIAGLLQTITIDLNKQVSQTEADDKENQANFVASSTAIKENIKAQEVETQMDTADLTSTKDQISKTLDDLKTQVGLMDDALAMVASLQPACLDAGGMSFKTRKVKRDEEVAALRAAMASLKAA